MSKILTWIDGYKTYVGAGIASVAMFLALIGVLPADKAAWLSGLGATVMAVGFRHALGKIFGVQPEPEPVPGKDTLQFRQ